MKFIVCLALMASGWAGVCLAASNSDDWSVREEETIQKTLTLSGAPLRVVIDNVQGYVHVKGATGSQVRLTAHKVIRAETDNDLQEAKREIKLDVSEKPGTVSIYYDAPWRCNCEGQGRHERRFYKVKYDIDVEVPRAARTVISTVNEGDVRVDNIEGGFDVSDVNGGISMSAISGFGNVHTVNGPVAVHFAKNPSGPCSFKSINGQLDIYFRPDLSADLLFKTFNGEIYSDFEVTPRASPAVETEQREGKFIYRSNRARGARAGRGGPELLFDAFNGSIRLHREQ
jgi:hypothetical protein